MAHNHRGMLLTTARALVKERFGAAGWSKLCASLPKEDVSAVWEGLILPTGWYDAEVMWRFLAAAERAFGPDVGEAIGRRTAEGNLKTYLDALRDVHDPGVLLGQAGRLWQEYNSEGSMEVVERATKGLRIVTHAPPGVPRIFCAGLIVGWGSAAIEAAGGKVKRVEHATCVHDGFSNCEYIVEWE